MCRRSDESIGRIVVDKLQGPRKDGDFFIHRNDAHGRRDQPSTYCLFRRDSTLQSPVSQ